MDIGHVLAFSAASYSVPGPNMAYVLFVKSSLSNPAEQIGVNMNLREPKHQSQQGRCVGPRGYPHLSQVKGRSVHDDNNNNDNDRSLT